MLKSFATFQTKLGLGLSSYLNILLQISALAAENEMYKECTGKSVAEIKLISSKAVALEVDSEP